MTPLVLLAMILSLQGNQDSGWKSLRLDLTRLFGSVEGVFALAMEDLSTGKQLLINEREMFHAASTMKTPVMIELYRQAREGRFRLDDSILVKNQFSSIVDGSYYSLNPDDDSDRDLYGSIGMKKTMRELIQRMITRSSNLATNLLIEFVDARSVTSSMRALGADSIQVLRGVEDIKAFEGGLNNQTSALDLVAIYRSLAGGGAVDEKDRSEMLEILDAQEFGDMIPALLPSGTKVAHKTGSIAGVQHDSGIVFLPDGQRYVLVVLSKELKENKEGKNVIAEASRKVYEVMVKEH